MSLYYSLIQLQALINQYFRLIFDGFTINKIFVWMCLDSDEMTDFEELNETSEDSAESMVSVMAGSNVEESWQLRIVTEDIVNLTLKKEWVFWLFHFNKIHDYVGKAWKSARFARLNQWWILMTALGIVLS